MTAEYERFYILHSWGGFLDWSILPPNGHSWKCLQTAGEFFSKCMKKKNIAVIDVNFPSYFKLKCRGIQVWPKSYVWKTAAVLQLV